MSNNQTLKQLIEDRARKLNSLKELSVNPYPSSARKTLSNAEAKDKFDKLAEQKIFLTGRITGRRGHGGLIFADLEDESDKIQLAVRKDNLSTGDFELFRDLIERGDFVEVSGKLFLTKAREKTLEVKKVKLLAKATRPLPEKWAGLKNEELKYRKRYLDLITSREAREKFKKRSLFIKSLRDFLLKNDFIEFETPILQPVAGGAIAKPFKTRHNALNQDYFLRIAPELYLKKLIVGGFERVFEIARVFRNEGISPQHNPDFTILEFYWAYADYEKLMKFTEEMIRETVSKICGSLKITYQNQKFDFTPPLPRIYFADLIKKELGVEVDSLDKKTLLALAKKHELELEDGGKKLSESKILDEIYKKTIRPKLKGPLFLLDYPKNLIPLAKTKEDDASKIATFQLVVNGWEIIKAYNELNDPKEQRERFEEQEAARKKGDDEAHSIDEDYLEALSYGMPPTAGWGMGIDRFLVLLLDQKNVRDVILFPSRKTKKN